MNKFRVLLLLLCITCSVKGWAQRELPSDTLRRSAVMPEVKHFGDYLLDTRLMNVKAAVMKRPTLSVDNVLLKDYSSLFRLDPSVSYSQGYTNLFSRYAYYGTYDGFPYVWGPSSDFMNMSSFTLKNGMHLNMIGQYDANGRLMPGVHVMPWEKHDFKGAFELKSANGAFGIRIEVSRENNPDPFY